MEKYMKAQSTCESCLSVCLMALLRLRGRHVRDSEETKILMQGLIFTKLDYAIGRLIYVANKFAVKIEQYTDFPSFNEQLLRLDMPGSVRLLPARNTKRLITRLVAKSRVIIYMDKYDLDGIYHYPHFVLAPKKRKKTPGFLCPTGPRNKKRPAK